MASNINDKTRQNQWVCLWMISMTILMIIALVTPGSVTAKYPKQGGTLKFGVENDFAGFELYQSSRKLAINGSIAANTMLEPLFRMDRNESLIPVLGLSADPSEGDTIWTIKLRQGVTFHDQTPFNADAVVKHWNRILDPENKYKDRSYIAPIESIEKVDDYTIQFKLKHAWLPFLRFISSSRSLMALIPSPTAVETGIQDRSPVGTGPFIFHEWKSGDQFAVVKNPDYWNPGKPLLDKIIFKPLPDYQTRYASLLTGDLDLIWMDKGGFLEKAKKDTNLVVLESDDNGAEIFILNTSRPPLDDINIRRAIAHAHNQTQQVAMVYKNSIPVVAHPFGNKVTCMDTAYRDYDPVLAGKLMPETLQPLEIECLHSNSQRGRETGEILQQNLKALNITVTPIGLEFGPVIKKVLSGDYQMSTWRISSRPDHGPSLFAMLHSKSRANFSHYSNPEMDKLLVAQRMETDPEKRDELLCKIARLINEDVPILYRGGMFNHAIAVNTIKGIPDMVDGIILLSDAWKQ